MVKKGAKTHKSSKKNLKLILIVAALVVLAVAGGYYGYRAYVAHTAKEGEAAMQRTPEEKRLDAVRNAVVTESSDQADVIETSLSGAADDEERASIYTEKAAYLYDNGTRSPDINEQALADALQAYELAASPARAQLIATIATTLNKTDVAAEYRAIVDGALNAESDNPYAKEKQND